MKDKEKIFHILAKVCENGASGSLLSFHLLWPLCGRAARRRNDPHRFKEHERKSFRAYDLYRTSRPSGFRLLLRAGQRVVFGSAGDLTYGDVFVPVRTNRLDNVAFAIQRESKLSIRFGTKVGDGGRPPFWFSRKSAATFVESADAALADAGWKLEADERSLLYNSHCSRQIEYLIVKSELERRCPKIVFVHTDNHPPAQSYVLAAKELGIPSVLLQHGLDCEIGFLDEAYADHLLVWGPERAERYRRDSRNQNFSVQVIGNPNFDGLRVPRMLSRPGPRLLWVTRPHAPEKCYSPNRWPDEGLRILDALGGVLAGEAKLDLAVKLHPYDDRGAFLRAIEALEPAVRRRVGLFAGDLADAFTKADIVLTEDSTAGLEAMLAGKPLVHVHFCEDPPSMPFASNGAAFFARNEDQLAQAISKLLKAGDGELDRMREAQRKVIGRLAGPMDGEATKRACEYIESLIA